MDKKQSDNLPLVPIIIAIAILGFGFMAIKSQQTSTPSPLPETPVTVAPETATPATFEGKVVDVEAGSFYYKPSQITIKKGEKVKIILRSVSMMHDFNIDELGVKSAIVKNGDTGFVEFTATQAGTFEYYCSVGQHRQNGQIGKITVEE